MTPDDGYELLDCGDGRRLERFGDRILDRPAPGATEPRAEPGAWASADLRYDRSVGWTGGPVDAWTIPFEGLTLELRPTEAGQVGLFPEHARLWASLSDALGVPVAKSVLHLFAHTGATTLALARTGAHVAHVDASRPAVAWARRNAQLSSLGGAPIRWLVDDAEAFVARELRRSRRYDGVVLDPPTYGHGAGGRTWRLEDRLLPLLESIARLEPSLVLVTAHTPGWDTDRLRDVADVALAGSAATGSLDMRASSGALLRLGSFVRVIIDR